MQTTNTFWTQVLSMELMYGTGMMDGSSTMMPYSSTMMPYSTTMRNNGGDPYPDSGSGAVTGECNKKVAFKSAKM